MILDDLAGRTAGWLSPGGPEADAVVSTRIRLARNVRGFAMPWRLAADTRAELEASLRSWIVEAELVDGLTYCNVNDLTEIQRQLLVERHLISRQLARGAGDRGVTFTPTESVSIMTNEEDHLRIQVVRPGLQTEETWDLINAIDTTLERSIPYATSAKFGYLTACPTNTGTGLRVSVMTHLPTLVQTKQIEKVFTAASRVGLVLRGLHGEGTKALGDFYQISNQVTFGRSEEEILGDVRRMVAKIVEWERGVRQLLFGQKRLELEDRVWRAWATLRYARRLSSEEAMKLLSSVRLGVALQILNDVNLDTVTRLFLFIQPAHLQLIERVSLDAEERDAVRARFVRRHLGASQ